MLNTKRLMLRHFDSRDASFIFELMNSPLYIKNIGDRGIKTLAQAEAYLAEVIVSSYQKNGYGLYAVVLKETGNAIGLSGLVRREQLPSADIGFGFLPEFMGKGYAYEASSAVMNYARNELKLEPILAITSKDNIRSQKLLNKLGLFRSELIDWQGEEILLLST